MVNLDIAFYCQSTGKLPGFFFSFKSNFSETFYNGYISYIISMWKNSEKEGCRTAFCLFSLASKRLQGHGAIWMFQEYKEKAFVQKGGA